MVAPLQRRHLAGDPRVLCVLFLTLMRLQNSTIKSNSAAVCDVKTAH